jgi:RNA-splicing ligase RtcB
MKLCQEFAKDNRLCIAKQILCNYFELPYYEGFNSVRLREKSTSPDDWYTQDVIDKDFYYFQCIHNYINFEDNIVRKGAISAKQGEIVLIPMNMRDGCIIGSGKGNEDWNCSAPHGAGRIMSRNQARKTFNLDEFKKSMNGIYTTSVSEDTIDEAPMVYKPMEEIIDCIENTVDIIKTIKPIYNFKAGD